jgi:hypothetical protein
MVRTQYVLAGWRFREITLGEVVRPKYSPEGGSQKFLSGSWFAGKTLRKWF